MKAMIFAAGLGSRLQTYTQSLPKALVRVGDVPLLELCLQNLQRQGVRQVVINVHHFADQVEDYVRQRKSDGLEILISDEREKLLETGGGVRKAADLLLHGFSKADPKAPVLLHNVDILSNLDIRAMMQFHLSHSAQATLAAGRRPSKRYLYFDANGRLTGWQNQLTGEQKPQAFDTHGLQGLAFSGIHILSAEVLQHMQDWPEKFSIMEYYLATLRTHCYQLFDPGDLRVLDVGKPESIAQALSFMQSNSLFDTQNQ